MTFLEVARFWLFTSVWFAVTLLAIIVAFMVGKLFLEWRDE